MGGREGGREGGKQRKSLFLPSSSPPPPPSRSSHFAATMEPEEATLPHAPTLARRPLARARRGVRAFLAGSLQSLPLLYPDGKAAIFHACEGVAFPVSPLFVCLVYQRIIYNITARSLVAVSPEAFPSLSLCPHFSLFLRKWPVGRGRSALAKRDVDHPRQTQSARLRPPRVRPCVMGAEDFFCLVSCELHIISSHRGKGPIMRVRRM